MALRDGLALAQKARVNCRTLRCINGALTTLARAVTKVARESIKCERFINITQYSDYVATDGANLLTTTGLDYTGSGSAVSDRFLVYIC